MKKFWGKALTAIMLILGCSLVAPGLGAKAASLYGNSNEEKIFYFLREELDINNAAASGVLANIQMESSFRPHVYSDDGTSFGICQWHASRLSRLQSWCSNNDYDWGSLEGQLYYLKYELTNHYPYTLSCLRSAKDSKKGAYQAAYDWCYYFEVPADRETRADERGKLAKKRYWPKYKNAKLRLTKGKLYITEGFIFKAIGDYEVAFKGLEDPSVTELVIPSKVHFDNVTAKVTSIAAKACDGYELLESVTIGSNVTKVGKYAFRDCYNLNYVTIKSKKIKTFSRGCFEGISDSAEFRIKKSVKKKYSKMIKNVAPENTTISKY